MTPEDGQTKSSPSSVDIAKVLEKSINLLGPLEKPTVHRSLHHLAHTVKTKDFQDFLQKCGRQTSTSVLLDLPEVQQFDRDITSLHLGTLTTETDTMDKDYKEKELRSGYLHSPLMTTVDVAKRKAMKRFYERISDKMDSDWAVLKGKLMQQVTRANVSAAPPALPYGSDGGRNMMSFSQNARTVCSKAVADQQIFDLLSDINFRQSLGKVKQLSIDMCPQYRADLWPIWDLAIKLSSSDTTYEDLINKSLEFLQDQFVQHMQLTLKRAPPELLIGPRVDFQSLTGAYGMLTFSDPAFPSKPIHLWFLIYAYLRSGKNIDDVNKQGDRALEVMCHQIKQKLEGQPITVRVENTGNGGQFEDFLVSFINDGAPTWDKWTAQDWLWFQMKPLAQERMHDLDALLALQQQIAALPSSHFESGFYDVQLAFLTFQFSQGLTALAGHDNAQGLNATMMHLAVVLQKSRLLPMREPGPKFDFPLAFVEYSSQFGLNEQLRRLRVLDLDDRKAALERLMDRPVNATNELLGILEPNGQFHPGLLETAFKDAQEPRQEFLLLCEKAGYAALEQGQYREALKLLYNAQRYEEVLTAMSRALRLPLMAPGANLWDMGLRDELRLFFRVFEAEGHNLVPNIYQNRLWQQVRRLMAVNMFYEKSGNTEEALYFFDQQRFVDNLEEEDLLSEYPKLLAAYVAVLFNAFKSPPRVWPVLRERVIALQNFLASHEAKIPLSPKLQSDLATLALK